ncbi:hypothetical protein [Desulfurobacterium atlanticum]|uniref:Uncharacterized protein n=1 Tax=Desulfurobacterium atlanticum TaxID=240169 RepID=A0A238ZIJ8_9BACT|nr:hypothetical protein [Desulfurobacterium atlanticum]SNR83296.1 hypothetical protein SAMN06265340_10916 [Desulfurobacterium atlanticum]
MDFFDVILIEHRFTEKATAEKKLKELSKKHKNLTFTLTETTIGYAIRVMGKTTAETINQIKKELEA